MADNKNNSRMPKHQSRMHNVHAYTGWSTQIEYLKYLTYFWWYKKMSKEKVLSCPRIFKLWVSLESLINLLTSNLSNVYAFQHKNLFKEMFKMMSSDFNTFLNTKHNILAPSIISEFKFTHASKMRSHMFSRVVDTSL